MSNSWDHLLNAKHIDRIVASWNQHRGIWNSARDKWCDLVSYELRDQVRDEAHAKCREVGRWDIWEDDAAPYIGPVIVLIAYDDSAHYLEMSSQELTTIALLGVTPAILLLGAVIAFEEIEKISGNSP